MMQAQLSETTEVRIVDSEARLQHASELVREAYICAIDAEWQPFTSRASATLVQLAVKCDADRTIVLLLDMLALPAEAARGFLQELFRNKTLLKVGYCLAHDLSAVSNAIGLHGSNCTAVVHPFVDLRVLSKQLRKSHPDSAPKGVGAGLAGLVDGAFGTSLDKQPQCSAWQLRPLTAVQILVATLPHTDPGKYTCRAVKKEHDCSAWLEACCLPVLSKGPFVECSLYTFGYGGELRGSQVHYAALDAACLLGVLGALVRTCLLTANSRRSSSKTESTEAQALPPSAPSQDTPSRCGTPDGEPETPWQQNPGSKQQAEAAEQPARSGADEPSDNPAKGLSEAMDALALGQPVSIDGAGLTKEAVAAARKTWGCRLETSGGQSQVVRLRDNQLMPGYLGGSEERDETLSRLPGFIPWVSDPQAEPRFVADVPQEGLARQLRLCGIDTLVAPNLGKGDRHLVHRYMVAAAEKDGRVILTGDRIFARRRLSDRTFLVRGADKKAELADVLSAFSLKVESGDLLSRCAKCNGRFLPRPMRFSELPEASRAKVPAMVVRAHDTRFWVCATCKQVYWRGSQFERCIGHLAARLQSGLGLVSM